MTVVLVDDELDCLASTVRAEYRRSKESLVEAVDACFACGHALLAARRMLPSNEAFGAWCRAQEFGFNRQRAHKLRQMAEYEPQVRAALSSQLDNGRANPEKALKQVLAARGGTRTDRPDLTVVHPPTPDETPDEFSAIVIDPPWQYGNTATRGAAEDHYPTMNQEQLRALELPAADNAHLYLWVTNNFVGDGLELCEAWGFQVKTMLTWVKPQMGMGNYFRSVTEHVVFGVRGSLPTNRRDRTNVINAGRTQHSAKPDAFYDLVEEMSPGPWLEMFARRRRMGWHVWGNEA